MVVRNGLKIGRLRIRPSRRGWTVLALCALLLSSYTADVVASIGRVRAGVHAGTLDLSGKTRGEANRLLDQRAQLLVSQPVDLFADTLRVSVSPSEIAFRPSVAQTLDEAMAVGRKGNFFVRSWHRFRALFARTDIEWSSRLDREAAELRATDWAARVDTEGHEAGIEARGATVVPVGAVSGRRLDHDGAVATMIEGLESWPRRSMELPLTVRPRRTTIDDAKRAAETANEWVRSPITLVAPDGSNHFLSRAELAGMLEAVPRRRGLDWRLQVRFAKDRVSDALLEEMKPYETEARSASFAVNGVSASVIAGQNGKKFDPARTAKALGQVAGRDDNRRADAKFSDIKPNLGTDEAKKLNIHELVSSFTTNHPCCASRVTNIHKIADAVDGAIVRPGTTFSLNGHAGPRTIEKGYVLAPMISDGEFKDDVGGGVSQFATTLFNAIFFGGYGIHEYQAHSYYISRYPAGREATVSWPSPDLKFTNDSRSGVLIKTAYSSTSITVSFYGDKEGKTVRAEAGPRTNPTQPGEKRVANPALPPGQERVTQRGGPGFDIVVYRITSRDGRETRRRFFTRYKPEPTIVEYGPGEPSPTPGPSPTPDGRDPRQPATPSPGPAGAPGSGT